MIVLFEQCWDGKGQTSVDQKHSNDAMEREQAVHLQAELPTAGTALNPLEEEWAFDQNPAAAPVNKLDAAMQQGE